MIVTHDVTEENGITIGVTFVLGRSVAAALGNIGQVVAKWSY